ncbi:MAG: tRNA lysidine(34) synthetase [Desulfovibrio sp.]
MARWGKLNYAQKKCVSATGYAMQNLDMVQHGSRIGLAISGGVDSFVMLQVMLIRQAIMPFPVELMVLHVNPGFEPESHAPLAKWCAEHGVPSHLEVTDFGPRAHTDENRNNSPCFYCAMLRRKRLFELCQQYNLSHLAFGHNAEDLAVTFFMNMFQNGRVDGLSANEPFFGGKLHVIRPTILLDKATVRKAANKWELPIWANNCPSNGNTKRDEYREWLEEKFKGDKNIRNNVYRALFRFQLDEKIKSP